MAKERLSSDSSEIKRRPRSVKKETETQKVQNASASKVQSNSQATNKKSEYQKGKLTSGGLNLVHGISNRAEVSTVHPLIFHANLIPPITYLAQFSE